MLKVPYRDSKTGLSSLFLEETSSEIAIISVGAKNCYGHPSQEALTLLRNNNIKVLRIDKDEEVEIVSDGKFWKFIN